MIVIIMLTQSLRFLELVIESGASSLSFWLLTALALPRFFEIILPLALMASVLFIYNRMSSDSELSAIRALGYAPMDLARPALVLSIAVGIFLMAFTLVLAPKSLGKMQKMEQVIKSQMSSLFLKEGVFNTIGDVMVYVQKYDAGQSLEGIIIHDARDKNAEKPITITARRGEVIAQDNAYQVIVYDGVQQIFNPENQILQKLNFERYSVDFPISGSVRQRWLQPDERSLKQLLYPDMSVARNRENLREFYVELNRRIVSPFLAIAYTSMACVFMLIGGYSRHGNSYRILMCIGIVVVLQSGFLVGSNLAKNSDFGLVLMYMCAFLPIALSLFFLSKLGEVSRRKLFYRSKGASVVS